MEWLIAHEDELNNTNTTTTTTATDSKKPHANKDSDSNTNSTDDNQAKTEAEGDANKKKLTVEEAQRLILERQAKRAEEERKKEIENEKRRRMDGQKMAEVRVELKDQEMINMAQQIRREKLEKEAHRKQLMEQIARDRENMRQKNSAQAQAQAQAASVSQPKPVPKAPVPRDPATECKIALRFADGSNLIHKFSPREQLSAVRLYVQTEKNTQSAVEFIAPPNKKLTESQMNETLESLGLCPASRLEVKYTELTMTD